MKKHLLIKGDKVCWSLKVARNMANPTKADPTSSLEKQVVTGLGWGSQKGTLMDYEKLGERLMIRVQWDDFPEGETCLVPYDEMRKCGVLYVNDYSEAGE